MLLNFSVRMGTGVSNVAQDYKAHMILQQLTNLEDQADVDDVQRGFRGDPGGPRHEAHLRHRRLGLHGRTRHLRTGRYPVRICSARTERGEHSFGFKPDPIRYNLNKKYDHQ